MTWGVPVHWGRDKGWVQMQDPFTGEWHEFEGRHLPWTFRRAAQAKDEERRQRANELLSRLDGASDAASAPRV